MVPRWVWAAVLAAFAWGLPSPAAAQLLRETGGVGAAFEIKVGPYLPNLAEEDGGSTLWDSTYGADREKLVIALGAEIQFLREAYGTFSLGFSAGLTGWEGRRATGVGDPESVAFNVIPMSFTLGYRLDLLVDRTPIPLAPYVRGGLASYLWWNAEGDGRLSRFGADEDRAIGLRPGLTATAGISVALDAIDPDAAARFRTNTGIRSSYLFFEGQLGWVDGFGDGDIDLSDLTWFAGWMLEI